MAAQLPTGLIRVVSASHSEITSSDPADIVFERKQALFNFWKVHDAQSRAIQDASNIRCRQLFWRVWGDKRLSLTLSQNTMMRLWIRCQQDFDLSPFHLDIVDGHASSFDTSSSFATQIATRRLSRQSLDSDSSASISPTHVLPTSETSLDTICNDINEPPESSPMKRASAQSNSKLSLTRSTSNNEPPRKRASITTAATRGKVRPALPRKRSSQAAQASDTSKPRRSTVKSDRPQFELAEGQTSRRNSKASILAQITSSPKATAPEDAERKISVFELPSVSSWQSVESHDPFTGANKISTKEDPSASLVDKNFRERFLENQKQLKSSTNLAGMNRAMRKTGSVVRFADEVDTAEDLRKLKGVGQTSPLAARAASDGHQPSGGDALPWRPPPPHRDSTGSVAAVSDDGSEELEPGLPRTKSQLSLAIADLKRSKSGGTIGSESSQAVTSPKIEEEQEALISGAIPKKKNEEEEKLLAMGREGGVTKAGGVNIRPELKLKATRFDFGSGYESPDEPIF